MSQGNHDDFGRPGMQAWKCARGCMRGGVVLKLRLLLSMAFLTILTCSCNKSEGTKGVWGTSDLTSQSTYASHLEKLPEGASEYPKVHIVNSRYLFVPYAHELDGRLNHVVLRETVHLEESAAHERENGRISVEAFPAIGASEDAIMWKFDSTGISGGIFDASLYSIQQTACCGASERILYFSLADGTELFSSTIPLAFIEHAGTKVKRYIGFDDGHGIMKPEEILSDDTVLGVLYYSSESALLHKAALVGKRTRECRAVGTTITVGNNKSERLQVTLFRYEATPTFDGIEIIVDLECAADGVSEHCRVPISGDLPSISQAAASAGVQIMALGRENPSP